MTTICNYLKSVPTYFRNNHDVIEDEVGSNIFRQFRTFKYIYVFYFFVDILHVLFMLSCFFQNKFICITTIGSVVKTDIMQIHMLSTEETTNLNCRIFNEHIGYHILNTIFNILREWDPLKIILAIYQPKNHVRLINTRLYF